MSNSKVVGPLVALLLIIVVSILVYFSVVDNVSQFSEQTETFTSDGSSTAFAWATSNASAWGVTLDNSPYSTGVTNVTCLNITAATESYPTFTLSGKQISVAADAADTFNQVNVTYTSHTATDEADVTDDAQTVMTLMPVIALVVIASIILAYMVGFGGRKGGF